MLALIQRVSSANVTVADEVIGNIQQGILALIGIEKADDIKQAERIVERILTYRIFGDENGKMNLSLRDIKGGLLLVPQFTLVAETHKGTRPGFSSGMPPRESEVIFGYLFEFARMQHGVVAQGRFGADMQVSLCNDGPVTFLLKT